MKYVMNLCPQLIFCVLLTKMPLYGDVQPQQLWELPDTRLPSVERPIVRKFEIPHGGVFLQQFSPMVGFALVLAESLACSLAVEQLKWLWDVKWTIGKLRKQVA